MSKNVETTTTPNGQTVIVNVQKKKVNHTLHFILTLCTFGAWLPVWVIVAIAA